ncbi:MAG TPA: hypothetical protein PLA68_01275 [Panacibacter sp.]|nr:hypothetical protein [Panacibacter sp.]
MKVTKTILPATNVEIHGIKDQLKNLDPGFINSFHLLLRRTLVLFVVLCSFSTAPEAAKNTGVNYKLAERYGCRPPKGWQQ